MSRRRGGRLPLALALAMLAASASAAILPEQWSFRRRLNDNLQYIENGERLAHALPLPLRDPSRPMPMVAVQYALMSNHAPASWVPWLKAAPAVLVGVLAFALASALSGSPWLALAASAASVALGGLAGYDMERWYSALVLMTACLAAWRARAPTKIRSVLLGAGVAASVFYRSPLLLYPLWVWLDERWLRRRRGSNAAWPAISTAALLFIPLVFLLWHSRGVATAVQREEGSGNLAWTALTDPDALDRAWSRAGDGAGARAAALGRVFVEVARHPAPMLLGALKRAWRIAGLQPVLLALALAAAWRRRRDDEVRAVALLASYFLAVHLPIGLLEHYLTPLWPLACVLGASLVADGPRRGRALEAAIAPALALSCAFAVYAISRVAELGAAGREGESRLDQVIAAHPGEPWPLLARGQLSFARGRDEAAYSDVRSALLLGAARPDAELIHAWLLASKGLPVPLLRLRPVLDWRLLAETAFRKAVVYERLGRSEEARREIRSVAPFPYREVLPEMGREIPPEVFAWLRRRLRDVPDPASPEEMPGLAPTERLYLASEIAAAVPDSDTARQRLLDARRLARPAEPIRASRSPVRHEGRLEKAQAAAKAGKREAARRLLGEELLSARGNEGLELRLAYLMQDLGLNSDGLRVVSSLRARAPWRASAWVRQARAELRAGRPDAARRSLEEASGRAKEPYDRHGLALAWQDLALATRRPDDSSAARAAFDGLVAIRPEDEGFRRDRDIFIGSMAALGLGKAAR